MTLPSTFSKEVTAAGRRFRPAAALLLFLFSGCVMATTATWRQARENQRRIDLLKMGQTTAEVSAVMGHGPERREARVRFDGKTVEEWRYMTDVVRKRDTTITFVDGQVVEIRTAPWEDVD
jgi:hypothetical protein